MNKIIKIIIFFGLILFVGVSIYATEIEVKSEISGICVYTDSALINRVTHLELDKGTYTAIFSNIIPEVDENSLRVSAEGTAIIKLFGAQVKREYLEEVPSERIQQLKEEIQRLEDEITRMQNLETILMEKKKFLNSITLFSNTQIPQDLITSMPQISDLENILSFLDTELKDIYTQALDCELKIRDLNNKLETSYKDWEGSVLLKIVYSSHSQVDTNKKKEEIYNKYQKMSDVVMEDKTLRVKLIRMYVKNIEELITSDTDIEFITGSATLAPSDSYSDSS